jgi:hypothetical protein
MIVWYYCDGNFPACGRIAVPIIIVVVIFVGCVIIPVFLACGIIGLGVTMVTFHVGSIVEVIAFCFS